MVIFFKEDLGHSVSSVFEATKTGCFLTGSRVIFSRVHGGKPGCFKRELVTSTAVFVETEQDAMFS